MTDIEMRDTLINSRWSMKLPAHRAARPEWSTAEGWERARLDAMYDYIGAGDIVYYCGAEMGEFPALCQTWGAYVYLFEPNPAAWPSIKAIWDANELEPPALCFAGFASNESSIDVAAGGSMLTTNAFPSHVDAQIVEAHGFKELYLEAAHYPQVTIDEIADAFSPPTVICFDVEGSEWPLLRGASQTLIHHHPTLFASIHPEFMFHQWGEYSADLRAWIKNFGYRETILDYQHELHCLYEWQA